MTVVEVDEVALEGGLLEDPVHEAAGFFLIEVEGGISMFPVKGEIVLPESLRGCVHEKGAFLMEGNVSLDINLFTELEVLGVWPVLADLDACFVDCGNEAEIDGQSLILGRALVDLLDAIIPCSDFSLLFPLGHFLLNGGEIRNDGHELRVREFFLIEGVGEKIPELENVAGRHGPEFEGLVGGNFPAGVDAHHIVVVQFAFDDVPAVAFFDLGDVLSFFVVEFATELVLDDVDDGGVVEFVGRFWEVFTTVHALHHGGVLAGSGDGLVFCGARAEPPITLEAEGCAVGAGFIFYAALDKEVISENLCDSTVFLKHVAPFAGFFREGVEKIESGAIRIHRRVEKVDNSKVGARSLGHDLEFRQ